MKIFDRLNREERVLRIIAILEKSTASMVEPAAKQLTDRYGRDPFLVLISCILSLRTKDTVSLPASVRLFKCARTPQEILTLSPESIQKLIYPCGFYKTKARTIVRISEKILSHFHGQVPSTEAELLSLPGVGIKTAALVLSEGFQIPALCVDTHVHRISNRLGLVDTKTAQETQQALKKIIPQKNWNDWNKLLVTWGQNICVPTSPFCSRCPLLPLCPQNSVTRHR